MSGWATPYIEKLQKGETVSFRPKGNSMRPKIESGQLCTVAPLDPDSAPLQKDDIVLCKVNGKQYLHLVVAVGSDGTYQIGNNRGGVNGWVTSKQIYGRLIKVAP